MVHVNESEKQSKKAVSVSKSDEPLKMVDNRAALDADALLQASRRLDWRFLFPDPELGRVACLGSVPADLLKSLRLFSTSVTNLDSITEQNGAEDLFDLIVVRNLSSEKLQLAAELLSPGGYLYAENDGFLSPKLQHSRWKHWRFAVPTMCATAVTTFGFSEVQAHWHWPNFGACTRIIPLDDKGALWFSFERGGRSMKARLRSGAGLFLLRSGLLKQIVPSFSIVARINNQ